MSSKNKQGRRANVSWNKGLKESCHNQKKNQQTPNNRVIHFWMVTADVDPEDWYGDIWGDSDEHSSEGLGELEERSVWPLIEKGL